MQFCRRLAIDNIKNARDLGGFPTLDGKVTSWGKFLRTATLDDAKDCDIKFLKDYGVKSLIDLRRESEIPFESQSYKKLLANFDYHQISLAPDKGLREKEIRQIINREISIGSTYRTLIDNYKKIREIMEVLSQDNGISLFHCQEGKDRTGIISMILLGLANVSRSDIIADYEISSAYLGYVERYDENEPYSVFRITSPYNMKEAYEYLIRKYESFEAYLAYAGVDKEIIEKLKGKLLS